LYTLNVEENKELSANLKIRSIPVIKSFSAGNEVNTEVGVIPESKIRDLAKNVLNG
jgi:thioredoxin-like negative regulator of GroEL